MTLHPRFPDPVAPGVFDETDRLLVDGALRLAERRAGAIEVSEDLYAGLLLVAKAIRHSHAAIALERDAFGRLFEQLWVERGPGGHEEFVGGAIDRESLRRALCDADLRVIDQVELSSPTLSRGGAPFVASCVDGIPAFLSTRRLASAECAIATRLIVAARTVTSESGADRALPPFEKVIDGADPSFVDAGVRSVIEGAMSRSISVLTGGPGTGKTTAIATMLRSLGEVGRREGRNFSIALCAPTAKAAVRMREALDQAFGDKGLAEFEDELRIDPRSGSVHRLLEIRPDASVSTIELCCDLVIVDEVSMLELTLLDEVLRCAGRSHVVLAGDPDQLVSVEVGAVLRDVVEAGEGPDAPLAPLVTRLTISHRSNDAIVALAAAINAGDVEGLHRALGAHPDELTLVSTPSTLVDSVIDRAIDLRRLAEEGKEHEALTALAGQVVLCANREGERSVGWWNTKVADALERAHPGVPDSRDRFATGTPIMVLKNESSATRELTDRLSNGDVGVVCNSQDGSEVVFLPVSESPRRRALRMIDQATAAWAFTIHKSQGSEYEQVVVSLPARPNRILSRELLYTAVTRAKHGVVLIGSREVVATALSRRVERVSGLTERLRSR